MKQYLIKITVACLLMIFVFTACKQEAKEVTPIKLSEQVLPASENNSECPGCQNCVHYIRCLDKKGLLPTWVYDEDGNRSYSNAECLEGKKKFINTQTPCVGCVVVMDNSLDPHAGHVAYVSDVRRVWRGLYVLKIKEGNYNGRCNNRKIYSVDSEIHGYQNPKIPLVKKMYANCSRQ